MAYHQETLRKLAGWRVPAQVRALVLAQARALVLAQAPAQVLVQGLPEQVLGEAPKVQ